MYSSDNLLVKDELIKLIKKKDHSINEIIFSYNTVWPVADIETTDEFKHAILEYVNSKKFITNFKRLPTQYKLCFIPEERLRFQEFENGKNDNIVPNVIKAIN